jgi:hypothetical protein
LVLYKPSKVQQEAHSCEAREILYGGTQNCGKTFWLRWDPIITQLYDWNGSPGEHSRYLAAKRAGIEWRSKGWALHLRRTFPMLLQTISKVLDFVFKVDPGAVYNSKLYLITFTCGYKWQFGHCQKEEDWRAYDTSEYSHIAFDEAIQFTKAQFDGIRRRLRCEDNVLNAKRRCVLASNPDAPVEGRWVKERFVDPAPEGRKLLVSTVTMFDGTKEQYIRCFIPAFLSDNPNQTLARQSEIDLRDQPRHIIEARLFGNWNSVEGAFFANLWTPSVHVVKPFTCQHGRATCRECGMADGIPSHWPRGRAMDWGYKCACVVMWFAKNEDGDLVIYREVTFNHDVPDRLRKDAQMVALAIKAIEVEHGEWDTRSNSSKLTGPADYQIRMRDGGTGPTIEQTMAQEGVYWMPSVKGRSAATAELIRRLSDVPTRPGAHPALMVFEGCKHLIRIMPLIEIDNDNPEEPKKDDNGHWLETLMYIVMHAMPDAERNARKTIDEEDRDDLRDARLLRQQKRYGYGL